MSPTAGGLRKRDCPGEVPTRRGRRTAHDIFRRVARRPRTSPWWPREPDRASARSAAGAGGLCRADRGSAGIVSLFGAAVGNGLAAGVVVRAVETWARPRRRSRLRRRYSTRAATDIRHVRFDPPIPSHVVGCPFPRTIKAVGRHRRRHLFCHKHGSPLQVRGVRPGLRLPLPATAS
jgi:hypothetical protein